jgi:antitoxin (DNA-binding transcriptional repressor) of toxin-antitoxin stability system
MLTGVKTITIRDLRQRWPETEAALQIENEILITRDAKPVAKLVKVTNKPAPRKRWTPEGNRRKIKAIFGDKTFPSADRRIAEARADRVP